MVYLNWYSLYTILGLIIPVKVYHVLLYFGLVKLYRMWKEAK